MYTLRVAGQNFYEVEFWMSAHAVHGTTLTLAQSGDTMHPEQAEWNYLEMNIAVQS